MTTELIIVQDDDANNSHTVRTYKGSALKANLSGEGFFLAEKKRKTKKN